MSLQKSRFQTERNFMELVIDLTICYVLENTLYINLGKVSYIKDYEENISRLFFVNYNIKNDHRKKKIKISFI